MTAGGVMPLLLAPAQKLRLACMAEARLAASSAASERMRAALVLDMASDCILAMPSRPTQMTTTATITSTRLKPLLRPAVTMEARIRCTTPGLSRGSRRS